MDFFKDAWNLSEQECTLSAPTFFFFNYLGKMPMGTKKEVSTFMGSYSPGYFTKAWCPLPGHRHLNLNDLRLPLDR